MTVLYITADKIAAPTGGGKVTAHELAALSEFATRHSQEVTVIRPLDNDNPFMQDASAGEQAVRLVQAFGRAGDKPPQPLLAHIYAGCFTGTVNKLKAMGFKISYTVAAHDLEASRQAHLDLGMRFDYPHLTDPDLFARYSEGYRDTADLVICPSSVPAATVRRQGRTKPIEIIPHGIDIPPEKPPHRGDHFHVGYMGAVGADKGLLTLARAWGEFNRAGKHSLHIAGKHSQNYFLTDLFRQHNATGVMYWGWVDDVSAFYRALSCYVQPSDTEGFGMEVTEAMAHGTPVICSDGAGASVHTWDSHVFPARDWRALVGRLEMAYEWRREDDSARWRQRVAHTTWDRVEQQYISAWERLTA